jgi:hypothetical protein
MSFNLENLTSTGILAAVLSWFMLRLETVLKENTAALNNLNLTVGKCPINDKKTIPV